MKQLNLIRNDLEQYYEEKTGLSFIESNNYGVSNDLRYKVSSNVMESFSKDVFYVLATMDYDFKLVQQYFVFSLPLGNRKFQKRGYKSYEL